MSVKIRIEDINKNFGSFAAIKSLFLECESGSFTAILGPSGCGKTTLLRLIAGFDSPSSGRIFFGDLEVSSEKYRLAPEKRNIGMVFQSFALWPHMTVMEHVLFTQRYKIGAADEAKGLALLESLGLEQLCGRYPHSLSGGQRQRVALARAVAGNSGILLMDEPLSSLDADLRIGMRQEILNMHRLHGTTVVYVTHDQDEAMAMADTLIVMNEGTIEQKGTPRDIYVSPSSPFVARFLSKANLVRGVWDGESFRPHGTEGVVWDGGAIYKRWKDKELFPVRPEQLSISQENAGIAASVETVQYQGREIHYTVKVAAELGYEAWRVFTPSSCPVFGYGAQVRLNLIS